MRSKFAIGRAAISRQVCARLSCAGPQRSWDSVSIAFKRLGVRLSWSGWFSMSCARSSSGMTYPHAIFIVSRKQRLQRSEPIAFGVTRRLDNQYAKNFAAWTDTAVLESADQRSNATLIASFANSTPILSATSNAHLPAVFKYSSTFGPSLSRALCSAGVVESREVLGH